ncbi:LysR substrate-binding domain-containing protein [Albimonas pacifica]|uniref:DNA-binding transcriptional regulator, LysR family n=1 Tax=Albimonas pacifica TaxID=1114924 RepID=A0A1I3NFL5_9RHOB|nr:LysR substrate-binding domain-containing protein [Albimonas pacifica]SFJ07959.1 DNA-binding transcriptional regulator, LysR family [Albimonas pacifica]
MSHPRRLYPSITALCAFEAAARLGSFTEAAAELSLSQSALSRQIAALEDHLGRRLLERSTRRVALTPEGAAYAREVAPALSRIRDATLGLMTDSGRRSLTIALLPTFGTRWLMPRMPRFAAAHPDVTIAFATRIGRFDLAAERIDAAIHHGAEDWPGARLTPLMAETVIPVASPAFPGAAGGLSAEAVREAPKLLMRSRPHDWQDWFAAHALPAAPAQGMAFEQFALVIQACQAGVGLALAPDFLVRPELADGRLVQVGRPIRSRGAYWFVEPAEGPPRESVRLFRDWLLAEAADAPSA